MSRYIDADKMLAYISRLLGVLPLALLNECEKNGIDIVRCKECRFGQWHEQAEEYIFIAHDQDLFDGDHFCSYGEREGE